MNKRTAVVIGLVFGLAIAKIGLGGIASSTAIGVPVWWLDR